jgi:hypothetical protein
MSFFTKATRIRAMAAILCLLTFSATNCLAEITITLKKEFIESHKNRATTGDIHFTVDHAGKIKPVGSGAQDGDNHNSGRAPEIGLPMVAEIMNARKQTKYVTIMKNHEGKLLTLGGVWRLWCEHGGSSDQIQGETVEKASDTNPDHVFEVHPITSIEGDPLLTSFAPIVSPTTKKEFKYKDASDAFTRYESLKSHISSDSDTVTIVTNMAGYNYVEFLIDPVEAAQEIEDGHSVMAKVLDLDGEVLLQKRRMVFVKGTAPEKALLAHKKGSMPLHVIGIPRIDLALVSWRVEHGKDPPEALDWTLPYEMVIVAVNPAVRGEAE